jgi:pathogenesis-related protein 1
MEIKKLIYILVFAVGFFNGCKETDLLVLTDSEKAALDFHNKVRNDVSNPPLEWDFNLAQYAQDWADSLAATNGENIVHRETVGKNYKNAGENIFWGSGKEFTFLDASEAWYSEIEIYTYEEISAQNYHATGHYTQMIWKDTKKIGMGISKSKNGRTIIVANYFPPGNFIGQKPY